MTHSEAAETPPVAADLATLRQILLSQERERLQALQDEIEALKDQSADAGRVLQLIQPLITGALAEQARARPHELAEAIRPALIVGLQKQVEEERDSLITVLTPIIGRTVQKSISEALEALARQIDARMQSVLNVGAVWRRLQNRARGVDESALMLREALPWQPQHAFLIHNDTGLVMAQGDSGAALQDPDLIAALLTAIRSFARESFRGAAGDSLHQIQYGDHLILLEEGRHSYIALVGQGVPPANIFQIMREQLSGAHLNQPALLKDFRGDPGSDETLGPYLLPLLEAIIPTAERPPTAGLIALALVLLALLLGCGWLGYRASPRLLAHLAPTAVMYLAQPSVTSTPSPLPPTATATHTLTATPSPSPSPTPSPSPSATPSPTPTHTPTHTPRPTATPTPAPLSGRMTGNVYVRTAPDPTTGLTGLAVRLGDAVRIIERRDPWVHIAYPVDGAPTIDGWIPSRWVEFSQ